MRVNALIALGRNDEADESWGPRLDGRTTGCVFLPNTTTYDTSKPCRQFFGVGPCSAHPNNVRDFWDNGLVTNVNVAVARSSERNNVRLSVGRTGEAGMYPSNSNSRTDLAISGGTQISNRWSAEASINYINDGMQNQPAQAYEEIDPMQNFIWFGRIRLTSRLGCWLFIPCWRFFSARRKGCIRATRSLPSKRS